MSAQDLINQYKQAAADEETAKQQKQAEIISSAQQLFIGNCRTWLGAVWEEIQVGEIEHWDHTNWDTLVISFKLPVGFMDIRGTLEQRVEVTKDGKFRWNSASLDFGYLDLKPKAHVWIQLESDNKVQAIPPKPETLGYVLSQVAEYAPIHQKMEQKNLEYRQGEALVFYGDHIPYIQSEMKRRIAEFPDMEDQIREAGQLVIQDIEERERAREEENRRHAEISAERVNLESMAARAWKKPFTLFRVEYGAFVDTDGDTITRSFYTFQDAPFEDGYWAALEGGKPSRRIRPNHILSLEELTITSQGEAPYEAKRYIQIRSKHVEGASAFVYLPPLDVFAFDIESIAEEMAAE